MFWRFFVIVPGLILAFWISSFFHGFTAFLVFVFLWSRLTDLCKDLFLHPAFRTYSDVQTLGLSSTAGSRGMDS